MLDIPALHHVTWRCTFIIGARVQAFSSIRSVLAGVVVNEGLGVCCVFGWRAAMSRQETPL